MGLDLVTLASFLHYTPGYRSVVKSYRRIEKPQAVIPEAFQFLMRGGDSEFINYLKYMLQGKCVQNVYEF